MHQLPIAGEQISARALAVFKCISAGGRSGVGAGFRRFFSRIRELICARVLNLRANRGWGFRRRIRDQCSAVWIRTQPLGTTCQGRWVGQG